MPNVTQPLSAKPLPFVLDHTFLSKAKTGEGTWQMIQAHSIKRNSSRAEKRIDESHMKKRIRRENSIFWFKVMFQNLEYWEQRCWAGKKMNRKREMNQPLKSRGKAWKMIKWDKREKPWPAPLHLLNQNDWLCFCSQSQPLLDKVRGESRRCRALQTCGSH